MNEVKVIKIEDNGTTSRNARKRGRRPKLQSKLPSAGGLHDIYLERLKHKAVKMCRVCLNEGDVPIYGDESIEDLSESLTLYGGIEVEENDNLPKFLCHACHEQLQNAMMFRKTAIETDQYLREAVFIPSDVDYKVTVKQEYLDEDIFKDTLADGNTKYHCILCSEDFVNENDYGTHMLTEKHSTVRDRCPFCSRKFNYIQKHLAHHREFKTVKCDVCNLKYLESMIKRHKETHFISPMFKCTECAYETRYSGDFKVHMRKHTGERPYQCQHCTAKFINKSNLNRHEYTHKNQMPFPCDQCDRGFYNERDLNMHNAADHKGIRDYLCNVCGKAFGYRRSMIKHQRQVHKREKLASGRKRVLYLENQEKEITLNKKIKQEKVQNNTSSDSG